MKISEKLRTNLILCMIGLIGIVTMCCTTSCNELFKKEALVQKDLEKLSGIITVEQRMEERNKEIHEKTMNDIYLTLPAFTFQKILERTGANATKNEIGEEYLRNRAYWISLEVGNKLPEVNIDGPDKNNIESIEMSVKMKEKEPEKGIPITVSKDSVK